MKIRLNNFEMAYDDQGKGISLLWMHGYPLSRNIWQLQMKDLTAYARLLAPDLRGFGESDSVEGICSMDLLAKDCQDFLTALGIQEPVVVGGLSMGGYVAFSFIRQYPQRVAGLVLAATRAGADSQEGKANRDKSATLAREKGSSAIAEAMLPKMLSPKTYHTNPSLVAQVKEIMETASVDGIVGALMGMRDRPDSTPTLSQIKVPTLILHGADDQLIPAQEAQAMQAAIKNSRLHILPGAGHLLNMEQPGLFNQAVQDFLETF